MKKAADLKLAEPAPTTADMMKQRASLQADLAAAQKDCSALREAFYASERKVGDLETVLKACEATWMDSMG